MSLSMKDVDPAFQGAGQKAGIEVWRIENSNPVIVAESSYGKFFTGESYIILKTNASKSGAFRYDIHYWLGKDTSQDEANTAAVKTLELDGALGGRSVQYRELQGHETERFLSYFKPCIIPREGEPEEHKTRMFVCKGKHVVHVQEVPCARSSLNHDDICILDSKNKIFQFNGSNTSIQERARALEVVQYIKDNYHLGKCDIATIEDGKLMADAEAGEFWGFFGGFAPLPRKTNVNAAQSTNALLPIQLFCVKKGLAERVVANSLTKKLLDTHNCYLLDCGEVIYVWVGRNTSLKERKAASGAAQEYLRAQDRPKSNIICMIENFEIVSFRSKFDSWPQSDVVASEDGRGKVAALLKRQGFDVKGLLKATPTQEEEEPQPYIDCSGNLQVWRVNGQEKNLLADDDQSKFYTGDCYIFQYTYTGVDQEECLIGTWFGKQSVEEERDSAISQANKMVESFKFLATQAFIYEGSEPFLFCAIFQSFMVLKGGLSSGYKNYISEKGLSDDTYREDGIALFRVQGTGPDNMQAIQVEPNSRAIKVFLLSFEKKKTSSKEAVIPLGVNRSAGFFFNLDIVPEVGWGTMSRPSDYFSFMFSAYEIEDKARPLVARSSAEGNIDPLDSKYLVTCSFQNLIGASHPCFLSCKLVEDKPKIPNCQRIMAAHLVWSSYVLSKFLLNWQDEMKEDEWKSLLISEGIIEIPSIWDLNNHKDLNLRVTVNNEGSIERNFISLTSLLSTIPKEVLGSGFVRGISLVVRKKVILMFLARDSKTRELALKVILVMKIYGYKKRKREKVASSLNSSYCYILHHDSLIFTWNGNRTTTEDHELAERQLDLIKPNMQTRVHKENAESEQFWEILGGKTEHATEKIARVAENDPHLFSCTLSKGGDLKVSEIYNFNQNDLLAEDIYIIDCHSSIFLWVGQQVDSKTKTQALAIGKVSEILRSRANDRFTNTESGFLVAITY
ncbi:hypothetical protein L6452_22140 [Arctium lappa]|uniref:Uncharacterized protein n=1 Tax=Arctium lappa TaxID=4217 RepID=A0ACB9AZV0_ARCLA|nr:hypothetical protein L6452_22140 [Arctium lappa]